MFQDKLTRRIIGWKVMENMTADLVVRTLQMALSSGRIGKNAIPYRPRFAVRVGRLPAITRASPIDERKRQLLRQRPKVVLEHLPLMAESFFSRFKAELAEDGIFEDVNQAKSETFSYIEGYYSRIRLLIQASTTEARSISNSI